MASQDSALKAEAAPEPREENGDGKRERSTIEFPYLGLDVAVEMAKGVHEVGGSSCQWDQLAAKLGQAANGGGFRQRVMTAKTFGLLTYSQGTITLTKLGTQICDPEREAAAKAESFLAVPLYKAVYEQFKGGTLPPASGLETAMVSLGVTPKQKATARQVFQRSATEAGFFAYGQSRLVPPAIKSSVTAPAVAPVSEPEPGKKKKTEDEDEDDLHPFIKGLLKKLPTPESEWPSEGRAKWLQAAINIFDLMYTDSEDSKRSLTIGFQKDSAKQ